MPDTNFSSRCHPQLKELPGEIVFGPHPLLLGHQKELGDLVLDVETHHPVLLPREDQHVLQVHRHDPCELLHQVVAHHLLQPVQGVGGAPHARISRSGEQGEHLVRLQAPGPQDHLAERARDDGTLLAEGEAAIETVRRVLRGVVRPGGDGRGDGNQVVILPERVHIAPPGALLPGGILGDEQAGLIGQALLRQLPHLVELRLGGEDGKHPAARPKLVAQEVEGADPGPVSQKIAVASEAGIKMPPVGLVDVLHNPYRSRGEDAAQVPDRGSGEVLVCGHHDLGG